MNFWQAGGTESCMHSRGMHTFFYHCRVKPASKQKVKLSTAYILANSLLRMLAQEKNVSNFMLLMSQFVSSVLEIRVT